MLPVERLGRGQVVAERLFDHHAPKAPLGSPRQAGLAQLLDDVAEEARRSGQVEEHIARALPPMRVLGERRDRWRDPRNRRLDRSQCGREPVPGLASTAWPRRTRCPCPRPGRAGSRPAAAWKLGVVALAVIDAEHLEAAGPAGRRGPGCRAPGTSSRLARSPARPEDHQWCRAAPPAAWRGLAMRAHCLSALRRGRRSRSAWPRAASRRRCGPRASGSGRRAPRSARRPAPPPPSPPRWSSGPRRCRPRRR